jgi:hypothetical protein
MDPFTLKNYVRARWYDPTTETFLSPDPMGYEDSSNLYAFAGGDPVNGRDPTGTQTRSDAKDLPRDFKVPNVPERRNDAGAARTNLMIQCGGNALVDRAKGAAIGSVPGVVELSTGVRMAQHAKRIINAADQGGVGPAIHAAWDAYTDELQSLPFIRWARPAVAASEADASGDACAGAYNRTGLAVDVASDVGLLLRLAEMTRVPVVRVQVTPSNGVVNVGGAGEFEGAVNLNPAVDRNPAAIPNLIQDYGDNIDHHVAPNSVDKIFSSKVVASDINWPGFAKGAYKVMKPGAVVDMNVWTFSAAEQAMIRAAFEQAGFKDVKVSGSGTTHS